MSTPQVTHEQRREAFLELAADFDRIGQVDCTLVYFTTGEAERAKRLLLTPDGYSDDAMAGQVDNRGTRHLYYFRGAPSDRYAFWQIAESAGRLLSGNADGLAWLQELFTVSGDEARCLNVHAERCYALTPNEQAAISRREPVQLPECYEVEILRAAAASAKVCRSFAKSENAPGTAGEGKDASINARMIDTMQKRPESKDWSVRLWQTHLGGDVSLSTIHSTHAWETLMEMREAQKQEIEDHQSVKDDRGRRRRRT